jgi:hypothetical protein
MQPDDIRFAYVDCEVELRNVRWHVIALLMHGPGDKTSCLTWDLISARWGVGGRQLDQHEISAVLRSLDSTVELTHAINRHLKLE